jgi:hypothetical protein
MLRPDPLKPARGGVQIVTGARRVEDLKGRAERAATLHKLRVRL